jgi:hypothetical protein
MHRDHVITCPVTAPMVSWIFAVHQALTSTAPVQIPLVLLADPARRVGAQMSALMVGPQGCFARVCLASQSQPAALLVLAQKVVSTMASAMQRNWQRVPTHTTSAFGRSGDLHPPATWFAGRSPDLKWDEFDAL